MKPIVRIAIVVIIGMLCSYACRGDELIQVTASVDKQSAYIGDLIEYLIEINYDSTVQLTPPPAGANLGGFEVKEYDFGEEEKDDRGRRTQTLSFKLRTFTTGEYVIPALPIEYKTPDSEAKYISADPIKISIKSMLAEGVAADSLEPRPLKAQAALAAHSWTLWILVGVGVLLLAGGAVYYFARRKDAGEKAPYVDPRPAWEIAFADLAVLKNKNLPEQGEIKIFYFELSEIIKRYLGKKFEFDAVDMTTFEVGEALAARSLDEDIYKEMMAFFEHADLVKFAKYIPSSDRPDADWDTAYQLVSKSKDMMVIRPMRMEPEPVMAAVAERETGDDDSDLRFAPPELRDYFSSNAKEDQS